jgi:hypothetical protein
MLHVWFGFCRKEIRDVDTLFDSIYELEWFKDPLVQEMIVDVDDSEYRGGNVVYDYLGEAMPFEGLSGGLKTLIMLYKIPNMLIDGNVMGDNCGPWLVKIGKKVECYITLGYDLMFGSITSYEPFECEIINLNFITKTFVDYYRAWYGFVSRTDGFLEEWKEPYEFLRIMYEPEI